MTALRRKESLRDAQIRKLKAKGTRFIPTFRQHGKRGEWTWKRRKPMKKVSKSQRERLKKYFALRKEWLAEPEHQVCIICLCRDQLAAPSTEVHHRFGRSGSLLLDTRGWAASCRGCRDWPHDNPKEARAAGVLGEAWEWGVPIDKHSHATNQ